MDKHISEQGTPNKLNMEKCREFANKAFILMDVTSSRFPFKKEVMELLGAAVYLIDAGISAPTDQSNQESMLMATTLIQSISIKMQSQNNHPVITYAVEFIVSQKGNRRELKRFIDVPEGINPENYVKAWFATSSNFVSCRLIGPVTDEEMRALKMKPVEMSSEETALRKKLDEIGLISVMQSVISHDNHLSMHRPSDVYQFTLKTIGNAKTKGIHPDRFKELRAMSEWRGQDDLKIWSGSSGLNIAFIVVDDQLRAVTLREMLSDTDIPLALELLLGNGVSWTFLRSPF